MKYPLIAILLTLALNVFALEPDENMNHGFSEIYTSLVSATGSEELIDKEYTFNLSLKFASEKYLIFNDAYIKVDNKEKYQIAKWLFDPEFANEFNDKCKKRCKVTFIIKQVRKTGAHKSMPHIVVQVTNVDA